MLAQSSTKLSKISVVIPAYNEGNVIDRCLENLKGPGSDKLDLIVVCNGCKDDTAERAKKFKDVKVIEIKEASKISALNEGDKYLVHFPVAYVDADVIINTDALTACAKVLEKSDFLACAPKFNVDLSRSNMLVKYFYRIWKRLPYFSDKHMIGSGVFILSKEGRSRFQKFPKLISDDGYVRSLFDKTERTTVDSVSFTVIAPKTLRDLIKIKTRSRFGNMELVKLYPGAKIGNENSAKSLFLLIFREPWLIPASILYCFTQWITKRRSLKRFKASDYVTWERDESSRT